MGDSENRGCRKIGRDVACLKFTCRGQARFHFWGLFSGIEYTHRFLQVFRGGIKWLPRLCSSLVYNAVACRFFQPFTSCLALPKLLNNRQLLCRPIDLSVLCSSHSIRSCPMIWKRLKWVPHCISYRSFCVIYSLARRNEFFEWGRQFWLRCAGRRGEYSRGMFQSLHQFCINLAVYSICSITSSETLGLLDNSFFASVDLLSLEHSVARSSELLT